MGSDSDLSIMKEAAEILDSFGVTNEVKIVSAHRTVKRMIYYAKTAKTRGIQVIIAGAGGAAHLPGMVAAITPLPVIGVPIMVSSSRLHGLDSLLSIVQMPPGVPVAQRRRSAAAPPAPACCTWRLHSRASAEFSRGLLEPASVWPVTGRPLASASACAWLAT